MPNPHPPIRPRIAPNPDALPPGYDKWRGRLRWRGTDPRTRKRVYITGPSVAAIEAKRAVPVPVAHDPRITVAAYLRDWSASRIGEVRSNTHATDAEQIERYLAPYFLELRLAELSPEHVAAWMRHMRTRRTRQGRPLAPRTVAIARSTLRKALGAAVPHQLADNPVQPLGRTPERDRRIVGRDIAVPSVAVLRALEEHLRGDRLYTPYLVASCSGLRQSELLGLRWSAVDFELRLVIVREVLVRHDRTPSDPKNAKSAAPVRVPELVIAALRARRQAQRFERLAAGRKWRGEEPGPGSLVFTDRLGRPLAGRVLTRGLQRALEELGLARYDWKSLRHAYVTGLLESGVDIAVASKAARHSSIDITGDVYAHYTERMAQRVADIAGSRIVERAGAPAIRPPVPSP